MKASEIMTRDPAVLTPEERVEHAAELMARLNVGAIPVVADRQSMRLTGIITDRDIAVRHVAGGHDGHCHVKDHMTRDRIEVVRPDTDAHDVMGRMARDQVRRMPVVEDGHRLVGIISQADLALRVGPREPMEVEAVLEKISEPARIA